MDFRGICL